MESPITTESHQLKREGLHEQIVEILQQKILSKEYQSGDRLPTERELTQMFGVSRITVRDAVSLLEHRGLVQKRVGSGTYVKDVPQSTIGDAIVRYYDFRNCLHQDLIGMREILEPEIAALAASNATEDDLAALKQTVEQIEANFKSGNHEVSLAADARFHEILAQASGNELLFAVASGLHDLMLKWINAQNEKKPSKDGVDSHRRIYQAIAARDPDQAREAARRHMRFPRYAYLNHHEKE